MVAGASQRTAGQAILIPPRQSPLAATQGTNPDGQVGIGRAGYRLRVIVASVRDVVAVVALGAADRAVRAGLL
jgi:hypothetical protein